LGENVRNLPKPIPEECLLPREGTGLRLLALADGWLAQCWRDGLLLNSRWWAGMPEEREWRAFLRASGLSADAFVPRPPRTSLPLMTRPWGGSGREEVGGARRWRPAVMLAASMGFALMLGYYGGRYHALTQALRDVGEKQARIERQARKVLEARKQALGQRERLQRLVSLRRYPGQLRLLAALSRALPHNGARLGEWNYDEGHLQVTISSASPLSNSRMVEALQRQEEFIHVQTESSPKAGRYRFSMDVPPL